MDCNFKQIKKIKSDREIANEKYKNSSPIDNTISYSDNLIKIGSKSKTKEYLKTRISMGDELNDIKLFRVGNIFYTL
tara:strand:- start:1314 stop:1544 length:231 start_codon:yes stop_codon:yes gene_type:complete